MMRRALQAIVRRIGLVFDYLLVRTGPRQKVHGLWLACAVVDSDCAEFFGRCREALELIRTYDPRRFNRIAAQVKTIATTTRGASYYEPPLRTLFLDVDVLKLEPPYIAANIVHEATHARIYHAGVRNYATNPERHERLCVSAEVEFATKLPNSERLTQELAKQLERPWWNQEGRRNQIKRFIRRNKMPAWLARFLLR